MMNHPPETTLLIPISSFVMNGRAAPWSSKICVTFGITNANRNPRMPVPTTVIRIG